MRSLLLGKHFSLKDFLLLLIAGLCFALAGTIHQSNKKPNLVLKKQDTALNLNNDLLVLMSAGNRRLLADSIWIQTLIESDLDHYDKEDMKNWMYLRFKSISKLDPLFYQNYAWGGQYLSVIKDDLQGAIDLLKDGLKYYPDDYHLNLLAGFTYYYELGNYEDGVKHLEKIMNHPKAPSYFRTIVLKMKVEMGFSLDAALELVKDQIENTKHEELKNKLIKDYYALKAERDIKCLNSGKINCDTSDAEGQLYIKKNGTYFSPLPFTPYRLRKKNQVKTMRTEVNTI